MSAHIVAFCGQKGGTGKSALAQAFAVEAAKEADNVMIVDLDEGQRTSVEWGQCRELNGHTPPVEVKAVPRLRAFDYADSCDVLVLDAPGWSDDLTVWAAKNAHLTVLPSKPTAEDLNPTIRLLHEMRAKGLKEYRTVVALNEVLDEKEVAWAREHLKSQGYSALPGFLRTVRSYREVRKIGKAVSETIFGSLNGEAMKLLDGIGKALAYSQKHMALDAPQLARVGNVRSKERERGA